MPPIYGCPDDGKPVSEKFTFERPSLGAAFSFVPVASLLEPLGQEGEQGFGPLNKDIRGGAALSRVWCDEGGSNPLLAAICVQGLEATSAADMGCAPTRDHTAALTMFQVLQSVSIFKLPSIEKPKKSVSNNVMLRQDNPIAATPCRLSFIRPFAHSLLGEL